MNKSEIIKNLSETSGVSSKEAKVVLDAFCKLIKESLNKGESVRLNGFGKFEIKARKERFGVNPSTKEKIVIPAGNVATFKAGKELLDAVN